MDKRMAVSCAASPDRQGRISRSGGCQAAGVGRVVVRPPRAGIAIIPATGRWAVRLASVKCNRLRKARWSAP
eukprot:7533446-Pyramimonas_sp.AAC.1